MAKHRTTVKQQGSNTWCVFEGGQKISCHDSKTAAQQTARVRRGGKK